MVAPHRGDSPPAVDPPQLDLRSGLRAGSSPCPGSPTGIAVPACTAGASGWHPLRHSAGLEIPIAQSLFRKLPPACRASNMLLLVDRGTAYGNELHACQDQGDRRDRRDALRSEERRVGKEVKFRW